MSVVPSPDNPSPNPSPKEGADFVMPDRIVVPPLDAEPVLGGPRGTGSVTTPDGVTHVSEITPDGMKQTRVTGTGDKARYNTGAADLETKMAALRNSVANADPEYLEQFKRPDGMEAPSVDLPPLPPNQKIISDVPLTIEQRTAMAEQKANDAAARAEEPLTYGGYTGVRISQMPGAVDSLGRPTGPVTSPPPVETTPAPPQVPRTE